jgi:topoisomerase IV subunit A
VTREDIEKLLEIKIKRISRYDINRQKKEIRTIERAIRAIEKSLRDMVGFTINYLQGLLDKYGESYPRRSTIEHFDEVDARAAAFSNLVVGYHRESGFLGHKIKAEDEKQDIEVHCSELDRLMLIFSNGLYKVINVTDKLFVGSDLLWMGVLENNLVFNLIYRNGAENRSYVKRFRTPRFIINREYRLFPQHKRSVIQFLETGEQGVRARLSFVPSSRAKYNSMTLEMDDCLIKSAAAKGKRVSTRVVRRISSLTGKPPAPEPPPPPILPGFAAKEDESGSEPAD